MAGERAGGLRPSAAWPPRSCLARLVQSGIRRSLGDIPGRLGEYAAPTGDPGLFGPDSMAWKVHADLPGMLIGGFAALMLQMLHPLAMAGVAEHSRFREDPLGRLQRTGRFIAGTTFGPMALVDQLVELGYVVRRPEAKDRRQIALVVTPKGHRILETIWRDFDTTLTEILVDVPPADVAVTARTLRTIADQLRNRTGVPVGGHRP